MKAVFIGLTGGIATGKSTVAGIFKKNGIPVIDCDKIAHRLLKRGFPNIDRKKLGAIVFKDRKLRRKLESILHPLIWKTVLREKRIYKWRGFRLIVADVPLLYEAGFEKAFDAVIVVKCTQGQQIKRCMKGQRLKKADAITRIKSQQDLISKIRKADYVIDNSGSLNQTKERVKSLLHLILMSEGLFAR